MRLVADAGLAGLPLGHADRGHLRVPEDGVRNELVVDLDHRIRVRQIVGDDSCLVIGHVLELHRIRDITKGEDAVDRGAEMGVRHDITGVVHRITVLGESELIAVRDPPRRNENGIDPKFFSVGQQFEHDVVAVGASRGHVGHESGVELLSVRLGEGSRNRLVLVAEHGIASNDEGDLRTEQAEHIAELRGDVAATEYGESFRQLVDSHDRVGGVVADLVEPRDRRNEGSCAYRDHDLLGRDDVVADLDLLGADEGRRVLVDGDIVEALAVVLTGGGDWIDTVEDPVADGCPVGPLEGGAHAQPRAGVGGEFGDLGGVHEHLRRDATHVHTGATEKASLDHGDIEVVVLWADDRVPGSCADDDEVVRAHGRRLGRPIRSDEHQSDGDGPLPAAGSGVGVWMSEARVRSWPIAPSLASGSRS